VRLGAAPAPVGFDGEMGFEFDPAEEWPRKTSTSPKSVTLGDCALAAPAKVPRTAAAIRLRFTSSPFVI
jgi:hypothetical protein